jgi:hypothetical protein
MDDIEVHLIMRQWVDESNGNIIVASLNPTRYDVVHHRTTWNHHTLTPFRHKRSGSTNMYVIGGYSEGTVAEVGVFRV